MRLVGLLLVIVGALALAYYAFCWSVDRGCPIAVPPLVSGIVLVFGLLVLATPGQKWER
ncbi:MAG: hypothetical protein L0241_23785 [Planctomycetia bacterium]|nr:hypothetical protein [Planctomycetia bacterium]